MSLANTSLANLVVTITGQPGNGSTTWTFSGSGTAWDTYSELVGTPNNWTNVGDFTDTNLGSAVPTSGSASITNETDNSSAAITQVFFDDDPGGDFDDIGFTVGAFSFIANDTLSWSGSLTVPVDLNHLSESPLPFTSLNSTSSPPGWPNLDVVIAAIPEPSGVVLCGFVTLIAIANFFVRCRIVVVRSAHKTPVRGEAGENQSSRHTPCAVTPKTALFSHADGTEDCACYYFSQPRSEISRHALASGSRGNRGLTPMPSTLGCRGRSAGVPPATDCGKLAGGTPAVRRIWHLWCQSRRHWANAQRLIFSQPRSETATIASRVLFTASLRSYVHLL